MRPIPLQDLARLVRGELHSGDPSQEVTGFATDSRQVRPGDAFIAIRGNQVDGHDFIGQALQRGAVVALVERPIEGPHILVLDVVDALARLGRNFRSRFQGPVIAITGSAGKTTTKEFAAAALSAVGKVLKTEGSRNTEYTAPLLWAELEDDHAAAVVELGMRGHGHIHHLCSFARPTIGVITNIGVSHLEQLGSREAIAQAKGELLDALTWDGVAILPLEDDFYPTLVRRARCPVLTFGTGEEASCRLLDYKIVKRGSDLRGWIKIKVDDQELEAELPVIGRHLALNACAAILAAQAAVKRLDRAVAASTESVPLAELAEALSKASLPPMRMQVLDRVGVTILFDAYNASPPATVAALETLAEMPCSGTRHVVLGEMKELGDYAPEAHRMVGQKLAEVDRKLGLGRVLLLGEPMWTYAREAAMADGMAGGKFLQAQGHEDVAAFLNRLSACDLALVKGSRALELERALNIESEPGDPA
jgi:UDP-N-acetylmuramoyl-tripeptide--D-alanyl-D-alanine ligase